MRGVPTFLATLFTSSIALANAPEDMFGASARSNGMGGTATATTSDGEATYNNPAGLARCSDSHVTSSLQRYHYGLDTTRHGADAPAGNSAEMPDQTRAIVSTCLQLPRNVFMGVRFAAPVESLSTLNLVTRDDSPVFPQYGRSLEHISINFGVAYRPRPQISVGVGMAMLVHTSLGLLANVPVGVPNGMGGIEDLRFDVRGQLQSNATPYLGVIVEPNPRWRLGLAYHGALAHHIELPLSIVTTVLNFTFPIPINLSQNIWYSPRTVSLGAAFEPARIVTLSADLTVYDYRARHALFDGSIGMGASDPFVVVSQGVADGSIVGVLIGLPESDKANYHASFSLRVGAEVRLMDGHLALRAGYALRTSPLPSPGSRNITLLDGTVHNLTGGIGYAFGRGWDANQQRSEPEPALYEGDERRAELSYRFDAYGRLGIMPQQSDRAKEISWGGTILDLGGSFTLGWR